jgi:hypothetical protein
MAASSSERLITSRDAARILCVSAYGRTGGAIRYREFDLRAWIEGNTI